MGDTKSIIIWECFVIFLPVHSRGRRCFYLTGQSCFMVKSLRNPWTWNLYYRRELDIQISFLLLRLTNSIVSCTYIVTLKRINKHSKSVCKRKRHINECWTFSPYAFTFSSDCSAYAAQHIKTDTSCSRIAFVYPIEVERHAVLDESKMYLARVQVKKFSWKEQHLAF